MSNHPEEKTGNLQVAASDTANVSRFVGLDELKDALGIADLEDRVAALEGKRSVSKAKADRMQRGKEDRTSNE